MDNRNDLTNPTSKELLEKQPLVKSEMIDWLKAIIVAIVLVFIIRWLLFAPFIVEGASMEPNFKTDERVVVNKIIYSLRDPKPGEVIVFHVRKEFNMKKSLLLL